MIRVLPTRPSWLTTMIGWKIILSFGFIRDIGKLITVNYIWAKDSVKKRLSGDREGCLYRIFLSACTRIRIICFLMLLRMQARWGGSDQWGNITTGAELIRRTSGYKECLPWLASYDKPQTATNLEIETGNIWLSVDIQPLTNSINSWLNVSDEDVQNSSKILQCW